LRLTRPAWPPPIACTALTRKGRPCRAPASRDTDPPLCAIHSGRNNHIQPGNLYARRRHGRYGIYARRRFNAEWLQIYLQLYLHETDQTTKVSEDFCSLPLGIVSISWETELAICRLVLRSLMALTKPPHRLDRVGFLRAIELTFYGAEVIARLYEQRRNVILPDLVDQFMHDLPLIPDPVPASK
jgi:hypothetical protein